MLSFSGVQSESKEKLKFQLHYLTTKSLQVPCKFPLNKLKKTALSGKRVLPFTSLRVNTFLKVFSTLRRFLCKRYEAGMTVEASVCLPLFLMFSAALMEPMKWLDRQRQIQTELEVFGEKMSCYAELKEGENVLEEFPASGFISDAAAGIWIMGKLKPHKDDIGLKNVEIGNKKGDILLEAVYEERIPFFPGIRQTVRMHAACRRRIWNGIDGKLRGSMEDTYGELEDMVYVGEGMGRYHLYRDCHYIFNQYQTVPVKELSRKRNKDGKRYKACARCAKGGAAGENVYVTPRGDHFHTDKDCAAMTSYVRTVPLKEVQNIGLCSYCERRKESAGNREEAGNGN